MKSFMTAALLLLSLNSFAAAECKASRYEVPMTPVGLSKNENVALKKLETNFGIVHSAVVDGIRLQATALDDGTKIMIKKISTDESFHTESEAGSLSAKASYSYELNGSTVNLRIKCL